MVPLSKINELLITFIKLNVLWNEKRSLQLVFHISTLQSMTRSAIIQLVQSKFDIYMYIVFVPFCMHPPFR